MAETMMKTYCRCGFEGCWRLMEKDARVRGVRVDEGEIVFVGHGG